MTAEIRSVDGMNAGTGRETRPELACCSTPDGLIIHTYSAVYSLACLRCQCNAATTSLGPVTASSTQTSSVHGMTA